MADRRANNESEASAVSLSPSLKPLATLGLRFVGEIVGIEILPDDYVAQHTSAQLLNRMLSTRSYISTASSQARRDQLAHDAPDLRTIRHIGEGQCGTVYAFTGTESVLKLAKEGKVEQLKEDGAIHFEVFKCFTELDASTKPEINIPRFVSWIVPKTESFWKAHHKLFPVNTPIGYGLLTTRIFPLPEPVREALFDQFAPPQYRFEPARTRELARQKNKDCLVRIYLGRRERRTATDAFKLRNLDLMVNEMENIGLKTSLFAAIIARALAILHWGVGVDGNDVEFVLGSAPQVKPFITATDLRQRPVDDEIYATQDIDFTKRSCGVWLLDFNQCTHFTHDKAGLKKLVDAFFWNDPYYPGLNSKDAKDIELWQVFKEAYLDMSGRIAAVNMAGDFILAVEAHRSAVASLF
nr:hypothetical protein B0A51_14517 [Rachicladosporium sp. CCFEE 5018]